MIRRVLLFARYREIAGSESVEVEVPPDATLQAVWDAVRTKVPALRAEHAPLIALDRAYATRDHKVGEALEVAFFPPVSGG